MSSDARPSAADREPAAANVSIRAATRDDLATVVALRLALLHEHGDNPLYSRLRADAPARARRLFGAQLDSTYETTFLAERGSKAVGILRCVSSQGSPLLDPPAYCYVSSVYVMPEHRRQGVLRALLARAVAWAKERSLGEIRLHSVAGHELSNVAWSALGFEVVELLRMKTVE